LVKAKPATITDSFVCSSSIARMCRDAFASARLAPSQAARRRAMRQLCRQRGLWEPSAACARLPALGERRGRPQQMQVLLRQVQVLPDTWVFLRRGKRHISIRLLSVA
jgi:hypothetical protein